MARSAGTAAGRRVGFGGDASGGLLAEPDIAAEAGQVWWRQQVSAGYRAYSAALAAGTAATPVPRRPVGSALTRRATLLDGRRPAMNAAA